MAVDAPPLSVHLPAVRLVTGHAVGQSARVQAAVGSGEGVRPRVAAAAAARAHACDTLLCVCGLGQRPQAAQCGSCASCWSARIRIMSWQEKYSRRVGESQRRGRPEALAGAVVRRVKS